VLSLENLNFLSEYLPLVVCLIFIAKIKQVPLKVFFLYAIGIAVSLTAALYFYKANNVPAYKLVYKFFALFELVVLGYFFLLIFIGDKLKTFLKIISCVIFCIGILSVKYVSITSYFYNLKNGFLVFCCFFYFVEKTKFVSKIHYVKTTLFWLVLGIFLYSLGHVFFFLTAANKAIAKDRIVITSVVTIIKNLIFVVGLWKGTQPPKEEDKIINIDESLRLDDLPESYNRPL
jgi:hypothetical protein